MIPKRILILLVCLFGFVYSQPFASFKVYGYYGCTSVYYNYIYSLYLYPADGSCFLPSVGYPIIDESYYYRITYNSSYATVLQYSGTGCSDSYSTTYYQLNACDEDTNVIVYPSLPDPSFWGSQGLYGDYNSPAYWETILTTNYYSQDGCGSGTITSVQVQGWTGCNNQAEYYCQNGQLYHYQCQDNRCEFNCTMDMAPLSTQCTECVDMPEGWVGYNVISSYCKVAYEAFCTVATLPTPTPTRTPSPSVHTSPSPSASPAPYKAYVAFTNYWGGCGSYNVDNVFIYPADGSCFTTIGQGTLYSGSYYIMTYNATYVTVTRYQAANCSTSKYYETIYYPIGQCYDYYIIATVYSTLPSAEYWASKGYYSYYGAWDTVLVTNYYNSTSCYGNAYVTTYVDGFPLCSGNGDMYYCSNDQMHYQSCNDNSCESGCVQEYTPLSDSCTPSQYAPAFWDKQIWWPSVAYQASCAGAAFPTPSPTPSASPTPKNPKASPSPSPSSAPYKAYAAFQQYYVASTGHCNASLYYFMEYLYLYPADGSCFISPGGISYYPSKITYNSTYVTLTEYPNSNGACSGNYDIYYYPINSCTVDDLFVTIYNKLPNAQYWATQGLVGSNGAWQTILVTNYYSALGCAGNTLAAVQVQGWPLCTSGFYYYCQNGELSAQSCQDSSCLESCVDEGSPLSNACTAGDYVPAYWEPVIADSIAYQATCVSGAPPSPSPSRSPAPSQSASVTPSRSPGPISPSPSPAPFSAYASFTDWWSYGCNGTVGNFVEYVYLYPADGSCFAPAGGEVLIGYFGYKITYNSNYVTVNQYDNTDCSGSLYTTDYPINACTDNVVATIYTSLPPASYWNTLVFKGEYGQWETILVTNYYSQVGCNGNSLTTVQVQGWPECSSATLFYCQYGELNMYSCRDPGCSSDCLPYTSPLSQDCTTSVNGPSGWSGIVDYYYSTAYQATCVGGALPLPSVSPSASPSPGGPPSPSPSPAPFTSYAAFTSYYYKGCNQTANNAVYDVYLYPADGSCFSPAGGLQFSSQYSYKITHNSTTVTVINYQNPDCSGGPSSVYYYFIGTCTFDAVVSIYSSLPDTYYWTSQNIIGINNQLWETILVTNYYSQTGCYGATLSSVQVQGWSVCVEGHYYHCENGELVMSLCADAACGSNCYPPNPPLDSSCTASFNTPSYYSQYLDDQTSLSYQASCAQAGIPPSPSPSYVPAASRSCTPSPSPSRQPGVSASPTSSPLIPGHFVSFTTYFYPGCNSTSNWIYDVYLYPADGSCFFPAGGYQLSSSYSYRITYNSTWVTVMQYSQSDCSDKTSNTTYYPINSCSSRSNVLVAVYSSMPSDQYWVEQDLVGSGYVPWQTVLVTYYFADVECQSKTFTTAQVQGWATCSYGNNFFCDTSGNTHYQLCQDTQSCASGCTAEYGDLSSACTPTIDAPPFWYQYLQVTTSASYQANCVQQGMTTVNRSSSSSLVVSLVLIVAGIMLVL